jgi:DNA-binding IclR family transcriptional regulator
MNDRSKSKDRYLVPGLVRGLEALRAFTPERPNLSLGELADILGTTRSATFRTVYTLADMGCLLHDERNLTYSLGPAVLQLGYGYIATRELVEVAQPSLVQLRDDSGWSAHLGVLDGTSVLYMLRLPSLQGTASIVHVGSRLPARSTTMGRILLAGLTEERVTSLYHQDAARTGSGVKLAPILAQRKRDRRQDTISHVGTFEAGIVSVAAPLRDVTRDTVAAISLSAHADPAKLGELDNRIRDMIHDTAARISAQLGWQKPRDQRPR